LAKLGTGHSESFHFLRTRGATRKVDFNKLAILFTHLIIHITQ
jgi:hypothetical protein